MVGTPTSAHYQLEQSLLGRSFQTAFRARHIPQGIMDRKKREFRNFTQGRLTVEAYQREFLGFVSLR